MAGQVAEIRRLGANATNGRQAILINPQRHRRFRYSPQRQQGTGFYF
jgi:hypothetical protein